MDENHQDKTESKRTATEDVRWVFNKKSKLWVSKRKKSTGFEDKTLWDKLNLLGILAIPLIIAFATIGFGLLQFHLADVQHQQDQQDALDQQHATILQTYIDNIQDLLLNHQLLKSSSIDPNNPYYDVAILARARTLTALQGLDPLRKGRLVQFLYEAELIGFPDNNNLNKIHDPIIELAGADLSYADLNNAVLIGANLDSSILSDADLSGAHLIGANLSYAVLTDASLRNADLSSARLSGAYVLTQQQLDQVDSCKNTSLPEGLTCHHNQSPP